ncbi:MAG TPA: NAD(P)H-hydrate dehydratase [Spirochaetota bacterium]|nr:NAD(P)H-hydrate dehydratase [Spirochaetota bacterium]HOR43553.1 NAD(P)H-hydrate dehydratase [Spirochaetota bacterium]HPK55713.1 NAD(P)H-hydrate dehydratase [Spirochaetota bacterium]
MGIVILSQNQSADLDKLSEFASRITMSNAARSFAEAVADKINKTDKIAIVCGGGNNGGDGFASAYYLYCMGFDVSVFPVRTDSLGENPAYFFSLLQIESIPVRNDFIFDEFKLILDCLTGTGVKGKLRGIYAEIAEKINSSGKIIFSCDIPSGLSDESLASDGIIVKADETFAVHSLKTESAVYPGKYYCGKINLINPFFPKSALKLLEYSAETYDSSDAKSDLKQLYDYSETVHKYNKPKVAIIGGFIPFEGAALLSALAALKSGASFITIFTDPASRIAMAGKIPEIVVRELFLENIKSALSKFDSIIIGPGFGTEEAKKELLSEIIKNIPDNKTVVIDADALKLIPEMRNELLNIKTLILTPHEGEAAVLLNKKTSDITLNRINSAIDIAKKYNAFTVLKGHDTICSSSDFSYVNTSGNNLLATAGSGDVLTGIIGTFCSTQKDILRRSALSVFVHGICADLKKQNNAVTLNASEIPDTIGAAVNYLNA